MCREIDSRRPIVGSVWFGETDTTFRKSGLVEAQAFGGEIIEPTPEQPIEGEDVEAEDADAERDTGTVAVGGSSRDIGADPGGGQRCVTPLDDLGDDTGVP